MTTHTQPPAGGATAATEERTSIVKVVFASLVGTAVEWYDFFLYGSAAALVFGTLFFGYGFGLWGQVPRARQVVLVVATFAMQILISRLWLEHFRYGPVEWLWRAATYGRVPPLRR